MLVGASGLAFEKRVRNRETTDSGWEVVAETEGMADVVEEEAATSDGESEITAGPNSEVGS